ENVGIVVLSGSFRAEAVRAKGCANPFHLVGCDGNADSGAADQDSLFTLSVLDRLSHLSGINGVIHRIGAVASIILIGDLLILQILDYLLLQIVTCLVAS